MALIFIVQINITFIVKVAKSQSKCRNQTLFFANQKL